MESLIEVAITPKTRAIVPVHYAGVACNMTVINAIAQKYAYLVEDAAQGAAGSYQGKPLGSLGQMAAYSFHETKKISPAAARAVYTILNGTICVYHPRRAPIAASFSVAWWINTLGLMWAAAICHQSCKQLICAGIEQAQDHHPKFADQLEYLCQAYLAAEGVISSACIWLAQRACFTSSARI